MAPPRPALARYLESKFPGCRLDHLTGDASTREFFRLTLADGSRRVVMDYGEPFDGETDDMRLGRVFREASLPVAGILEVVPDPGCLVLEDLGDTTVEQVLISPTQNRPVISSLPDDPDERKELLYRKAVELAVAIAVRGTPALARSELPHDRALDRERFRFEMSFFLEHYVGGLRGLTAPAGLEDQLFALADDAAQAPSRVLCHRDFHSRNLLVRPDGSLAMVDIQDARWGPGTYDLASLLRDAYVDLEEDLAGRMLEFYRQSLPQPPDAAAFRRRFDIVAAQRMIKALGTFGYQVTVRGRQCYLESVPRTLRRLDRLLPRLKETVELHRTLKKALIL